MQPLPEIREAGAPPEIAACYARLRQGYGMPLVNLIWRHLATMPGVLPWAVAAVAPVVESGRLAGARDRLAGALELPAVPPVTPAAWASAGLDAAALAAVRDVLAAYNRGNLANLVLLTALRRALEAAPAHPANAAPPAATGPELPALPPLPRLAELPPATATLVQALAANHESAASGIIPSLWLHLSHWPGLLAALPGWFAPVLAPAALREARLAAIALAEAEADALRPLLAMGAGLPPEHRAASLAALTTFTTQLIPDMVPVGLALSRGLPG